MCTCARERERSTSGTAQSSPQQQPSTPTPPSLFPLTAHHSHRHTYTRIYIRACVHSQSFHRSITIAIAIRHKPTLIPNHESLTALFCFCCGRYSLPVVVARRCCSLILAAVALLLLRGVFVRLCVISSVQFILTSLHHNPFDSI